MKYEITIIGNAVMDFSIRPVTPEVFVTGSLPVEEMKRGFGGDALNEGVDLSRLGKSVELVTVVGNDEAGQGILNCLRENGVGTAKVRVSEGMVTSVNVVLIDEVGERYFLTNPAGSQRRLTVEDVLPALETAADLVCFAGIFVSTALDPKGLAEIFRQVKRKPGRILAADMTKAKHGETVEDMREAFQYVDYLMPNEGEAALLTGERDPYRAADRLLEAGVGCAVIKRGAAGCLVRTKDEIWNVPAWPGAVCVDTTGAGDAFTAGFLWGLSEGADLRECACFACATASCAVETVGANDGVVSLKTIRARYEDLRATVYGH